jgi:spore coat protein CotH
MPLTFLRVNWDNYGYDKNNYYLYHDAFTNQFRYVAYDCDNTFGIDWLGKDWVIRNVYNWENQDEDRPLLHS